MKIRLFITFLLIILTFSSGSNKARPDELKENFLWIEYEDLIKNKNDSLTLPLNIKFGIFPNAIDTDFDEIKAFYSFMDEEMLFRKISEYYKTPERFYEVNVTRESEGYSLNIDSYRPNYYTVIVQATKKIDETSYKYSAKTSFVIFGDGKKNQPKYFQPVLNSKPELDFKLTSEFNYWPQTGQVYEFDILFGENPLLNSPIYVCDSDKCNNKIKIDRTGSLVYIPPEDKDLNSKGDAAFKNTVLLAKKETGSSKYLSSYTLLLHRSRYANFKFIPGVIIFGVTFSIALAAIILKRRSWKY